METVTDMQWKYSRQGQVSIFSFTGELTVDTEDDLKLLLMRAVHGLDRAVLNFQAVTRIDDTCRKLLRKAYCTSIRMNNPLILTEIPKKYLDEVFNCEPMQYSI